MITMVSTKSKVTFLTVIVLSFTISPNILFKTFNEKANKEYLFSYRSEVTFTNEGPTSFQLSAEDRTFSIFTNNSWQTVYLQSCNWPYNKTVDQEGNPIIILDVPLIPPARCVTISVNLCIIEKEREAPRVTLYSSGDLDDIPEELKEEYCKSGGIWLFDDDLKNLAYQIWNAENYTGNVLNIVASLANWIGENTQYHSFELGLYPNETLHLGKGDCDDQSNLLIALCRILGIPAFLQLGCLQVLELPERETFWDGHLMVYYNLVGFHAWAMIYIPPWGWLPFDMTWGWNSNDPLNGIRTAAIYNEYSVLMLNITKSNWIGSAKEMKKRLINHQIYVYDEEELIMQPSGTPEERFWKELPFWLITSVVLIGLIEFVFREHYHCNKKEKIFN